MSEQRAARRILIIDDEEVTLFAIRRQLRDYPVEVDTASSLAEAVALLQQAYYDAVITDLRLSGTSGEEGLQIIQYVRQIQPQAGVALVTAYGSPEVTERAYQSGASFVLEKPVSFADLLQALAGMGVPLATG